jgi:hypothetical protein
MCSVVLCNCALSEMNNLEGNFSNFPLVFYVSSRHKFVIFSVSCLFFGQFVIPKPWTINVVEIKFVKPLK